MQTIGDRADLPAGTAVSGRSTADSSGISGPSTEYDALMRERDALVYHRQMLERKRTELEQSLQKQRSEKEVCPALFVFHSPEALSKATQSYRVRSTFSTHGTAHQFVHNSPVLSFWSTPIRSGVGATGLREYQRSFHAHYLTRNMGHAERLCLHSANPDAVIRTLTSVHLAPVLRRLELDLPELSEPMVQSIYQLETEGRLEFLGISLRCKTPAVQLLSYLSSLRSLDLCNTTITNEELRGLQGCRNLVKLDLSFCRGVTDLSPILHIQTLEVVSLSGCHRLFGCGTLGRLPRLKEIHLGETRITDGEILQLSQSRTLVKIDLNSCAELTNVNPLSSITTLEEINLSGCSSFTHVGALGRLPALKELDLSFTPIKDKDVCLLSDCKSLVKIDLHSCRTLTNVNHLSFIGTLEEINLSHCTSLIRMGLLIKLRFLKEVNLREIGLIDAGVNVLTSLREQLGLLSINIKI